MPSAAARLSHSPPAGPTSQPRRAGSSRPRPSARARRATRRLGSPAPTTVTARPRPAEHHAGHRHDRQGQGQDDSRAAPHQARADAVNDPEVVSHRVGGDRRTRLHLRRDSSLHVWEHAPLHPGAAQRHPGAAGRVARDQPVHRLPHDSGPRVGAAGLGLDASRVSGPSLEREPRTTPRCHCLEPASMPASNHASKAAEGPASNEAKGPRAAAAAPESSEAASPAESRKPVTPLRRAEPTTSSASSGVHQTRPTAGRSAGARCPAAVGQRRRTTGRAPGSTGGDGGRHTARLTGSTGSTARPARRGPARRGPARRGRPATHVRPRRRLAPRGTGRWERPTGRVGVRGPAASGCRARGP